MPELDPNIAALQVKDEAPAKRPMQHVRRVPRKAPRVRTVPMMRELRLLLPIQVVEYLDGLAQIATERARADDQTMEFGQKRTKDFKVTANMLGERIVLEALNAHADLVMKAIDEKVPTKPDTDTEPELATEAEADALADQFEETA